MFSMVNLMVRGGMGTGKTGELRSSKCARMRGLEVRQATSAPVFAPYALMVCLIALHYVRGYHGDFFVFLRFTENGYAELASLVRECGYGAFRHPCGTCGGVL